MSKKTTQIIAGFLAFLMILSFLIGLYAMLSNAS